MNVIVLLAMTVNLMMVFADLASDDNNGGKGKREAPMAEPSTDYTPPRLEAPYATYSPLIASANAPQASYYQSPPFNQGATAPAAPYEYNRYTGVIPLPADGNDLGNGIKPYGLSPTPFNGGRNAFGNNNGFNGNNGFGNNNNNGYNAGNGFNGANYGAFNKFGQNSQGQFPTSYAQLNGLSPSLTVYDTNGNGNKPGFYAAQQSPDFKSLPNDVSPINNPSTFNNPNPFNGRGPSNFDNPFYGNPSLDVKYPSSAELVASDPRYAADGKGFNQPHSLSSFNTQALKNSRPIALTPPHLQRKPSTFLNEPKNPNFRPSFLLGSSVLSSTPDYDQPTLTSLGTLNPYLTQQQNIQLIPEQYASPLSMGSLPLSPRDYLPAAQPQFLNGYQSMDNLNPNFDNFGGQLQQQTPVTSYGDALPETIIYTKSSLYGERYGYKGPT